MFKSSKTLTFILLLLFVQLSNAQDFEKPGFLNLEVVGGPHAGEYGGGLDTDSCQVFVRQAGEEKYLALRLVHVQKDKSNVVFSANLTFDGKPGTFDLKNTIALVGVDNLFRVMALQGSGTLVLEAIDRETNSAKGTFTFTQGEVTITGHFKADV